MTLLQVAVICGACALPVAALGDTFCADLRALVAHHATGGPKPVIALPGNGTESQPCRTSVGLGGTRALHCAWPFAYRDAAARNAFEQVQAEVGRCLDADAVAQADDLVNHPDSYDLATYLAEEATVSVSLKDKGALQETYVFLRIETQKTP